MNYTGGHIHWRQKTKDWPPMQCVCVCALQSQSVHRCVHKALYQARRGMIETDVNKSQNTSVRACPVTLYVTTSGSGQTIETYVFISGGPWGLLFTIFIQQTQAYIPLFLLSQT